MGKKRNFFEMFMAYQHFLKGKEDVKVNEQPTRSEDDSEEKVNNERKNLEWEMCKLVADMTALYDYITEISGFKESVKSDIQLVNDLWLYTITKFIQLGRSALFEVEDIAQSLMDKLEIAHPISVSEHLDNMQWNELYRKYIASGFGEGLVYPGLFWELLASMNGRAKDGNDDVTISFVKQYIEFLRMLGRYLQLCDLNGEYEELTQVYINELLDKQRRIGEGIYSYPDHSLLNPLIDNEVTQDICSSELKEELSTKEVASIDLEEENISDNFLPEEKFTPRYNVNQVVWDNEYVSVTYVGIVKQGNFWGIKMLVDNKMDIPLTLSAYNICMNNFVVTNSSTICYNLPAHRKMFAEASMMFSDLEDLGINCIEDMSDIELTLACEEDFKKIQESLPMILCVKEYVANNRNVKKIDNKCNTFRLKNKDVTERKDNTTRNANYIYIEKSGETIWDNEFINIVYMGIYKGSNYWGIKISLENKTKDELFISTSNIEMNNQIIKIISFNVLKPYEKKEGHISIGFDKASDWGINSIEDFDDMMLELYCEKNGKKIAQSSRIVIHPIDYLKEIHTHMSEIMDEIDNGIIWKNSEEKFPETVEFEFVYPNGKHGDIDLYLVSQWGVFEQISSISFKAKLTTENLHIIELMVLFYYTQFSQNALLMHRKNNEEAVNFLSEYNNIMKLNNIHIIASREMERKDILGNFIMQKAYNIIKDKYRELKNERSDIYSEIVANNEASSKWKSEQQVYAIVRKEYEDAIYQYHAEWLGRKSLDVYIPSLNTAIEYQGIQHYEPLEIFGGEENFKIQQQRDMEKKKLCAENGVRLIEWKYDIIPNLSNLKNLLKSNIVD